MADFPLRLYRLGGPDRPRTAFLGKNPKKRSWPEWHPPLFVPNRAKRGLEWLLLDLDVDVETALTWGLIDEISTVD